MGKQNQIEMHGLEEDQVDEMDFGSIGKTLSKYGKGVGADPVKSKRSSVHPEYTMTGHKEGKSTTGRVYTKVMSDDDDSGKAAKSTVKAEPEVKRGRGRPAGAVNKAGTGKGWSAEAKASMKAKLAARKAAKLAAAKNESVELGEADWVEIVEGQSLDAIVEFMLEEEYQALDELSKKTLGSYIKKASTGASHLATNAMHLKNTANMHQAASRDAEHRGDQLSAVQRDSKSAEYDGYSHDASKKQLSRLKGVAKATDRLTKESEQIASDLEESNDHVSQLLADKDINSTVSGQTVKVHKSNVAAASKIIKAAGYSHSVVGGLNESEITESVDPKIAMYASMLSGNLIKE